MQTLRQHSAKPKHVEISKITFSNTVRGFETCTSLSSTSQKKLFIAPSLQDKVSATEALWLFKTAEKDMSLQDSDNVPALFQNMFTDSEIAKSFTMGRNKATYIYQDGLGSLLASWLCKDVSKSEGTFSLIFYETTMNQRKKQMDLLLRFWDENI